MSNLGFCCLGGSDLRVLCLWGSGSGWECWCILLPPMHAFSDLCAWMADPLINAPIERDAEQAITALKKGAYLLKYGRRGKLKFCPFRLSNEESILIWYSGKDEKQLKLGQVSKIIPGQQAICKDKDEAEVWFVGLKALISCGNYPKWRSKSKIDGISCYRSSTYNQGEYPRMAQRLSGTDVSNKDSGDVQQSILYDSHPFNGLGKVFSDVILYTAPTKGLFHSESLSG